MAKAPTVGIPPTPKFKLGDWVYFSRKWVRKQDDGIGQIFEINDMIPELPVSYRIVAYILPKKKSPFDQTGPQIVRLAEGWFKPLREPLTYMVGDAVYYKDGRYLIQHLQNNRAKLKGLQQTVNIDQLHLMKPVEVLEAEYANGLKGFGNCTNLLKPDFHPYFGNYKEDL